MWKCELLLIFHCIERTKIGHASAAGRYSASHIERGKQTTHP